MMRGGIIAAIAVLAVPLAAHAEPDSKKQAALKEALRVQQLICDAMADVRARGGDYADNNFSLCFIGLEAQRAEYLRVMTENSGPGRAAAAASASLRPTPGGLDGAPSSR
ncbi:MAG TPA: hypothetical protein VFC56_11535 [Stellaceae bacterium]|nr:hypothetical protein [Stellaceae bacterium]